MADITNWTFRSLDDRTLPPPFTLQLGRAWHMGRLALPLLLVLCGPAVLAFWFRRRMKRTGSAPGTGVLWLNWVLLGTWLYWVSMVGLDDLIGFGAAMDSDRWLMTLLLGALLFCGPPLAATAICVLALAPELNAGEPEPRTWRVVRVAVARQATLTAPLGLFLMGTALVPVEFRAGLLSVIAAYAAFRALKWCVWRWTRQSSVALESGELRHRAGEIATAAGIQLRSVTLLGNRSRLSANAFASAGGQISLTRSLVENLTRREVDAVIGHEVGHLRGKHISWRLRMVAGYMFIVGPVISRLVESVGLPAWAPTLPIAPFLFVMVTAWISQTQELAADARAAKLTSDPEGCIAALARLARLTKSPIDWKGIQGSILSHPSMRRRVLALARRSGVEEARALAILNDPDLLVAEAGGDAERYALPEPAPADEPVFSATARMAHIYWCNWVFGGALMGLLLVVHAAAIGLGLSFPQRVGALLASLPIVTWLTLTVDQWWSNRFMRRMRRRIETRNAVVAGGMFVALLPGDRVQAFDGVYAWDLGAVFLAADRLTYEGEQVRFSVARSEVESIQVVRGPLAWLRTHAVEIRSAGAAFSLRLADRGSSRRLAKELEGRLLAWKRGEVSEGSAVKDQLKTPELPELRPAVASRQRVALYLVKTSLMMFAGTFLVMAVVLGFSHVSAAVPLAASFVYLAAVSPTLARQTG